MLTKSKETILTKIQEYAQNNILKKLKIQGINRDELNDCDFDFLVLGEIERLKSKSKKVAIVILISLLAGI